VTDPAAVTDAWARAWAADRPYVLTFTTDPATPMLPPLAAVADEKVDEMRSALDAEAAEGGEYARRARRLLDSYEQIERRGGGTSKTAAS
jgi:pyruvate dehydrogenase (quinone)